MTNPFPPNPLIPSLSVSLYLLADYLVEFTYSHVNNKDQATEVTGPNGTTIIPSRPPRQTTGYRRPYGGGGRGGGGDRRGGRGGRGSSFRR